MTTQELIKKFKIQLADQDALRVQGKPSAKQIAEIKEMKSEIINELKMVAQQRAARQAELEAKWTADKKAEEQPLIDAMNADAEALRKNIPAGHVEVTVEQIGNLDGYPTYKYSIDGFELSQQDVNIIGVASATRPGAMAAFESIVIASISASELAEVQEATVSSQQAETEKAAQNQAEVEQKFAEAQANGKDVLLESWMEECPCHDEECSTDVVYQYAQPDGTTRTERQHTW